MGSIFNRRFVFQLVFFWLFMATLLMLIDWSNGVHQFEGATVLRYYVIWLFGGILYAVLQALFSRWFFKDK